MGEITPSIYEQWRWQPQIRLTELGLKPKPVKLIQWAWELATENVSRAAQTEESRATCQCQSIRFWNTELHACTLYVSLTATCIIFINKTAVQEGIKKQVWSWWTITTCYTGDRWPVTGDQVKPMHHFIEETHGLNTPLPFSLCLLLFGFVNGVWQTISNHRFCVCLARGNKKEDASRYRREERRQLLSDTDI